MKLTSALLMAAAGALLASCSLSRHVADAMDTIEHQYSDIKEWKHLPLRTITWNQALAIMERENAEMISAQHEIEKAERNTLQVYTDLIPTITYYSYVNKSLRGLSEQWSQDDVTQNINVTFSIPTLTQVPYRIYASRATAYAAVKAREGKKRELASKLYLLIRKHELDERRSALEKSSSEHPAETSPVAAAQDVMAEESYWSDTAKLLGDPSARWNILPSSVPHVRWADYRTKIDRLDPLIICRYALQLERAHMAQYSVALSYLPTINTSLYSPSLFSSTGGTYSGTFLDSDDTHLNLSLSYTIDTHLRTWERYKDNKDEYERARREVRAGLMEHRTKLAQLKRSLDDYEAWQSFMHKREEFLRNAPAESAEEYLSREKELHDMQKELLDQEEAGLESEGALIIEYGMPGAE